MNSATTQVEMQLGVSTADTDTHIVPAPFTLKRFEARAGEGPGTWISYAAHPAYKSYGSSAKLREKVAALLMFGRYFGVILCKRLISYELIPIHLRDLRSPGGVWRFLHAAMHNVAKKLARRAPVAAMESPVATTLVIDGICVVQIDNIYLTRIASACQPLFEQMRKARGSHVRDGRQFEESRCYATRASHGDLFAAIESMLSTSGVLDGISKYLRRPASLVDVNPQINDPSDDFWRHNFPDLPPNERPADYFHRDASGGDIKAIIYMSDVGPDNGPFCYAIGSHRVRSGKLINWIEETNDQSGCSDTAPISRARFAALPSVLQRKCAFGNDIMANSEIADRLLAAEWKITAQRGHVMLFDTKGFHRGGMVTVGERLVLTCVIG